MSIGVGYLTARGCWLGADSCSVRGGYLKRPVKKLVNRPGRFSFVVSGTYTAGAVVLEALENLEDNFAGRCVRVLDFSKELRRVCGDSWAWKGSDSEGYDLPQRNLSLLLTDGRVLVEFTNELGWRYAERGEVLVIGSGSEVALGAGWAVRKYKPGEIVSTALEAACKFSAGCDYPYESVEVLPGPFELVP